MGSSLLFQMYDRAISAPTSPTRLSHSGKRSWEEPNWMGSPRLLNKDMKSGLSRSLQTLPTDSSAFDTGEKAGCPFRDLSLASYYYSRIQQTFLECGAGAMPFMPSPSFWGRSSHGLMGRASRASLSCLGRYILPTPAQAIVQEGPGRLEEVTTPHVPAGETSFLLPEPGRHPCW